MADDTETILENEVELLNTVYIIILVISCFIAMFLNVIIIVSIYWIRTPMTPILKMSLSLAAADACSSTLYAANLFGLNIGYLEMVKLMGIVITVAHLLALSVNHYLGILKPLHYNSIVTKKKLTIVLCLLWICPVLIVGLLSAIESNNQIMFSDFINTTSVNKTEFVDIHNTTIYYTADYNNSIMSNITTEFDFMRTFRFRISYSSLFFIPMVLMAFCYTHILFIVRKQQKVWKNLSRIGSTKWKGRSVNGCSSNRVIREQKQLEGNLRAICTTLLIMGSCFIGWMPALLLYSLMCEDGCFWQGQDLHDLNKNYLKIIMTIRFIENLLIIMKMLANAIIYSIRMKEIKDSIGKMCTAIERLFCRSSNNNVNYRLACQRSPVQNSATSIQIRITSFRNNNGVCSQSITQPEHNTFL